MWFLDYHPGSLSMAEPLLLLAPLTWMAWGIALALHAFSVFILPKLVGDDWEERMIQKHMKEELNKD